MSTRKISSTYWTFSIIAVIFMTVIGYVAGYSFNEYKHDGTVVVNPVEQPDVSGDILDQKIIDSLYGPVDSETGRRANTLPPPVTDLHVFTGYVKSINDATIIVEHTDSTTEWPDALSFQLQYNTAYAELYSEIDDAGFRKLNEATLTVNDIAIDDIVSVYTVENILDSDIRTVTKVQKIKNLDNNINNL